MNEIMVQGVTLPEAYHEALYRLYELGDHVPCPNYNTNQREVSMTIVVEGPLSEPRISRLFYGDPASLEEYRQEMVEGIFDFEVDAGKLPYTYHHRMGNQLPWVIEELKRNPDSRQAIIDIRTPQDMGHPSPACLQNLHFFIRKGKLHMKALLRSNDATKAAFMNAYGLIELQSYVANQLGIPVGTYTHRADSFHVYERDYEMLQGYIKRITEGTLEEVTYEFKGDWDEQMEAARPEIAAKVADMKNKAGLK